SNPFLIYDLITCEITDLEFSNTKAVSWDTKDIKETSDAKITTTTTHKQTLRASIVTKGPSYFTKRVFELWNTNMPELNFKLTTRYSPKDNDLMRRIQSDIWHLRVTKQPIDKVF